MADFTNQALTKSCHRLIKELIHREECIEPLSYANHFILTSK